MTRYHLLAVVFAPVFAVACAESQAAKPTPEAVPAKKRTRSNIRSIPVPAGTKLSCDRLMPDTVLAEHLDTEVVVAAGAAQGEGNATCSVKLAGERPKSRAAQRRLERKLARAQGTKTALIPGDEMCQVTVQCSFILDADSEASRCQEQGGTVDHEIGAVGCLRSFRDGQRYGYSTLDYDTGCRYEVVAGGRLSGDEAIPAIRECAEAAVNVIAKEDLGTAVASR